MEVALLSIGVGAALGVLGGAFALGLRHGIDWDHIAAITDITSTTASGPAAADEESWLTDEPGVLLTDESHHLAAELARRRPVAGAQDASSVAEHHRRFPALPHVSVSAVQWRALFLGSLYALGHGTMVAVLGVIAILASGFLPEWVDPIMERIVGFTLVLLAGYLFYSLYAFFRGGAEFRLRSRWMLIFAGVGRAWHMLVDRFRGEHQHTHLVGSDQYGAKTAYSVGLIHGIGAETGTQVLIIATAVGAGSKGMGIAALMFFVLGLLVSNSFVTIAGTAGFVSAQRRQFVYIVTGVLAAVFSLVIGLLFLFQSGGILPDLGQYFRWIGGPDA